MKLSVDKYACEKAVDRLDYCYNLTSSLDYRRVGYVLNSNSLVGMFIEFWREVLLTVAYTMIVGILYKFRKQVRIQYRKFRYLWLNVPARIRATSIEKYENEPRVWLSAEVFESIQTRTTDKLTKEGVHEHAIELVSDRLGMPLVIWLEEEYDTSTIGSDEPEVLAFKVEVDMQADLRLGIRDVDEFQDFVTLANQIHESVRETCFGSSKPYEKYVLCRAKRDTKLVVRRIGKIQDDKLKVQVETEEGMVEIISSEPTYLVRALKKYFPI